MMSDVTPTSPPQRRGRDPEGTRAAILAAATALFSEQGFESTTTGAISRRAGVAEGSIFHHFGNKQGVLAAVATCHGQEIANAMFSAIRPGEPPDVRGMLTRVFVYAEQQGQLNEILANAGTPGNWACALNASHRVIIAALTEAFRQWREQGFVSTERPDIAARLMFSMVEGALQACFHDEQGERRDAWLDEAVLCVLAAMHPAARDALRSA